MYNVLFVFSLSLRTSLLNIWKYEKNSTTYWYKPWDDDNGGSCFWWQTYRLFTCLLILDFPKIHFLRFFFILVEECVLLLCPCEEAKNAGKARDERVFLRLAKISNCKSPPKYFHQFLHVHSKIIEKSYNIQNMNIEQILQKKAVRYFGTRIMRVLLPDKNRFYKVDMSA